MKTLMAFMFSIMASVAQAEVSVGVLAPQGYDTAKARWSPFFAELEEQLGTPLKMVPVLAQEGTEAFFAGLIDVLIGNPVQSAVVSDVSGAEPVASLITARGDTFAGVIVVPADSDIQTVADLEGRRFASLGDWAAGGYLYQAAFIMSQGLPRPDDMAKRIKGRDQNELLVKVLSGTADAAFVRTGVLEQQIAAGNVPEGALRVLHDKKSGPGDLHRTTEWYPEWFVVARAQKDPDFVAALRAALIGFDPSSPGAQTARVAGFQEPLDVSRVVSAMQQVGVAPYN